jgi:hypothetical protein
LITIKKLPKGSFILLKWRFRRDSNPRPTA